MIELSDGKYRFEMVNDERYKADGTQRGETLVCKRHGEHWRDFIGDNAVLALFRHAEAQSALVRKFTDQIGMLMDDLQDADKLAKEQQDKIDKLFRACRLLRSVTLPPNDVSGRRMYDEAVALVQEVMPQGVET